MIYVGIDDTDTAGSRGTNQLARSLVSALSTEFRCVRIVRHQLLQDPRVPCTTQNGSASITLQPRGQLTKKVLAARLQQLMRGFFVAGSDPGLCVTNRVPPNVIEFGRQCKSELVRQQDAVDLAKRYRLFLAGLGGTNDGVIGALAAVGLAATGDDGRVVQIADWPDDLTGEQSVDTLRRRGVSVQTHAEGRPVYTGVVDIGKRLRPNRRGGADVLIVEPSASSAGRLFRAMKLP